MEADNSLNKNNPPCSISDIRSTLAYVMEDGYNDRFTFTDNGVVMEVYDEHLSNRVLTCEYVDGHYIMCPFPDTDIDDRCVLKDGSDDPSPWLQLNTWLDAYDTEYPVSDRQYIDYLEKEVENLEQQLNDVHCKLVATEIERDILKDKQIMNNKEEQIAWLNNEITNLQYELSQPCINYDYKAKQLTMYKSFLELIYETKGS